MGRETSPTQLTLLAALTLLVVAAAGCLGDGAGDGGPAAGEDTAGQDLEAASLSEPLDLELNLVGENCIHGGGVAYNPIPPAVANQRPDFLRHPPEPFGWGDVTEYMGTPAEEPEIGIGNAHIGLTCESWTVNDEHAHEPSLGWVGLVVTAPGFEGVQDVERNYLLSTLATRDPVFTAVLEEAGLHIYEGVARVSHGEAAGFGFGSTLIETVGDGHYITDAQTRHTGEPWGTLRLWFIVEGQGQQLHPGYLDIQQPGASAWLGPGAFTHAFTSDHGPAGRGDSLTGSMFFQDVDVEITGVLLPHTMDGMWHH